MAHSTKLLSLTAAALLLMTSCADDGNATSTQDDGEQDQLSEQEQEEQERQDAEDELAEATEERDQALAGPSEDHHEQAAEIVSEMSLEQKAGQVIVGEYSDTDADSAAELVEDHNLAGMILMGHNIPGEQHDADLDALAADIETITDAGAERAVPPMISVDQEGGLVTRVGSPLVEWPTPMAYGAITEDDVDDLTLHGHRQLATQLRELGFTATFAPNADVTMGSDDPTMGSRSFGSDSDMVGERALDGIRGISEGGLAGSVKHFPGHGSVTEDSHIGLPVQEQSLEELQNNDWQPFASAIESGVPMVMMGHLEVPALESGEPSSTSPAAYEQLREMGHDGVIVTDAMNMGAVVEHHGDGAEASVLALASGADLILMPSSVPEAHEGIIEAVGEELDEERLDEAAERVVALALWQDELAAGELAGGPDVELPSVTLEDGETLESTDDQDLWEQSAEETAGDVAQQSITMVAGTCGDDVTEPGVTVTGGPGTERDQGLLNEALESAGVATGGETEVRLEDSTISGEGDVVVALDRPEPLADTDAATQIALYSRSAESYDALVEVLAGAEAPGALPVGVGEQSVGQSACAEEE